MNISALIIDVTLWGSVAILGFMAWQRGRVVLVSSMREGTMDFINIVPRIALGVIGSATSRPSSRKRSSPDGWGRTAAGSACSLP